MSIVPGLAGESGIKDPVSEYLLCEFVCLPRGEVKNEMLHSLTVFEQARTDLKQPKRVWRKFKFSSSQSYPKGVVCCILELTSHPARWMKEHGVDQRGRV